MNSSQLLLFCTTLLAPLVSCTSPSAAAPPTASPSTNQSTNLKLTAAQTNKIGRKIWQNESAGKVSGLTAWNPGEEFPSLGIGHFIWYPTNYRGPFTESFPAFIRFAKARGNKNIPQWLLSTPPCPWASRTAFYRDINKPRLAGLRKFLADSVTLQTEFIIYKSRSALNKILLSVPAAQRARIKQNYAKVATTTNGTYALIDYVNFKGEGINPKERYNGKGWGLLQVLQNMQTTGNGQAAARAFAQSAKRMLSRRIQNSPSARGESRWREGWYNRCNTYAAPLK